MPPMPARERLRRWAASPWVLLASVGVGAGLGLWAPRAARMAAPVGEVYLDLLTMCVLPVMMTALVSAVARALGSGAGLHYLRRLSAVFVLVLLAGAAAGIAAEPGASPRFLPGGEWAIQPRGALRSGRARPGGPGSREAGGRGLAAGGRAAGRGSPRCVPQGALTRPR